MATEGCTAPPQRPNQSWDLSGGKAGHWQEPQVFKVCCLLSWDKAKRLWAEWPRQAEGQARGGVPFVESRWRRVGPKEKAGSKESAEDQQLER